MFDSIINSGKCTIDGIIKEKKFSGHSIRFLLFNGDVDMACNFMGDQWFIERMAKRNEVSLGLHDHSKAEKGYFNFRIADSRHNCLSQLGLHSCARSESIVVM